MIDIDTDGTLTEDAKYSVAHGIKTFAAAVNYCAHGHGWWSDDDGGYQPRNMGEMIALMHSELSEALESHRNSEPYLWFKYPDGIDPEYGRYQVQVYRSDTDEVVLGKPEGIATEFADCIIRILDTCMTLNIPVVEALLAKHAYNITRPYRHGGKAC